METVFGFLNAISDFINKVLAFDILPGISLFTVLFYNLLLVVVVTTLTRR